MQNITANVEVPVGVKCHSRPYSIGDNTCESSDGANKFPRSDISRSCSPPPPDIPRTSPRKRRERISRSPRSSPRKRYRSRSPYRCAADFGSGRPRQSAQIRYCLDFPRGRCYRGERCRFLHPALYGPGYSWSEQQNARPRQSNVQLPECADFLKGRCYRGGRCRYLHRGWYGSIDGQRRQQNFESRPYRRYFCHNVEQKDLTARLSQENDGVKGNRLQPTWDRYSGSGSASKDFIADDLTRTDPLKDVMQQHENVALDEDKYEVHRELNSHLFSTDAVHISRPSESITKVGLEDHSFKNKHLEDANGVATSKVEGLLPTPIAANRSSQSTTCQKEDIRSDDSSFVHLSSCINVELPLVPTDDGALGGSNKESSSAPLSLNPAVQSPRRKLLILDVNGLLADIVPYEGLECKPDTEISRKAVFRRPFCDDFVKFCLERFDVAVWSSRARRNVDAAVKFLMPAARKHLRFCWDQSHCTETGHKTLENKVKPLFLKELKKVWDKQYPDLPWKKGEYNESNTLLLDDSPYKALRNPPNTAIFPHPYSYKDAEDKSLGPGGDIRVYLERLEAAENIQDFVKDNPFGQTPISPTHSSWSFFLKIIEGEQSEAVGKVGSESAS